MNPSSAYRSQVDIPDDYIAHVETSQSSKIRTVIETVAPILVDGVIEFTPEGMFIRGEAKTIYVDLDLKASKIEFFRCKRPVIAPVNFSRLFLILKDIGEEDILCFQINEKSPCILRVFEVTPTCTHQFDLNLRVMDNYSFDWPSLVYDTNILLGSVGFQRLLKKHERNADTIRLAAYNHRKIDECQWVIIASDGEDAEGRSIIPCNREPGKDGTKFNVGNSVIQADRKNSHRGDRYALRQLNLIAKATGLSRHVELFLGSDGMPLLVRYQVGTLGTLSFLVATRIPDDDEPGSRPECIEMDEAEIRRLESMATEKSEQGTFRRDGETAPKIKRRKRNEEEEQEPASEPPKAKRKAAVTKSTDESETS